MQEPTKASSSSIRFDPLRLYWLVENFGTPPSFSIFHKVPIEFCYFF